MTPAEARVRSMVAASAEADARRMVETALSEERRRAERRARAVGGGRRAGEREHLAAEIREVEIDRDVDGFARCWTEYAVVVNGYEEDRYPERSEAEALLAAFRRGDEQPTLVEPWLEEVRWVRPGTYVVEWTNPRTTDVIGCLFGLTETYRTEAEARAVLVADAQSRGLEATSQAVG